MVLRFPTVVASLLALLEPTHAQLFSQLWQVGTDNNSLSEFSQESFNGNTPPGSPTAKDDDFYWPTEPTTNFERALTSSDHNNRVHFTLTADQASDARLRFTADFRSGGSSSHGWGSHDIGISLNGGPTLFPTETVVADRFYQRTFDAPALTAGDNYIQVTRSGGTPSSWIGFDYLRLDIDDDALEDSDNDGLPRHWEETYGLDDSNPGDASLDSDGDTLTNTQEHAAGTNPTDRDSDNDGATDNTELANSTSPLNPDSDADTIPDGTELELGTNPLLADSDSDGSPDPYELHFGSDPTSASDTHALLAGTIGLNIRSTRSLSSARSTATIAANTITGAIPQLHWNNTPVETYNRPVSNTITGLTDSTGTPTLASATLAAPGTWATSNAGSPQLDLFGAYLDTNTDIAASTTSVTLDNIPYTSYHAFVYVGADVRDRVGTVRINNDPDSDTYFLTDTEAPLPGYKFAPASATTASAAARANIITFSNLSAPTLTIHTGRVNTGDNIGIHAIQIVDASADTDADTIPDAHELLTGTDPYTDDASADPDSDNRTNAQEFADATDPHNPDTDDDTIGDGAENLAGTDPLDPDTDGDGLRDGIELSNGIFATDPLLADSDSDSFDDKTEIAAGTDPNDPAITPNNLTVPVYSSPAGIPTWTWTVDNFNALWNHEKTLLRVSPWDNIDLAIIRVRLDKGPSSSFNDELSFYLNYRRGALVWVVSVQRGAWTYNGNTYWSGEWDGNPDLIGDFGFSGHGAFDLSHPLRFTLTATQPDPATNLWTLQFDYFAVSNPAAPVLIHSHSRTGLVAQHASLLDGSATWETDQQEAGRSYFFTAPGVTAGLFGNGLPADPDADLDGMDDAWETTNGVSDPGADPDNDGLSNRGEFLAGTDPNDSDSDSDGAVDGTEIAHSSNPNDPGSVPPLFADTSVTPGDEDLNNNGLADLWETAYQATGLIAAGDDDRDGFPNADESNAGTDPFDPASNLSPESTGDNRSLLLSWTYVDLKTYSVYSSDDLLTFTPTPGLPAPVTADGQMALLVPANDRFHRIGVTDIDTDTDGLSDYAENILGTDPSLPSSSTQPVTTKTGTTISGDYRSFAEHMQGGSPDAGTAGSSTPGTPSRKSAARFLSQASFGPSLESIDALLALGPDAYEKWIDDQIEKQPATLHRDYIDYIRKDFFEGDFVDQTYGYDRLNFAFLYGNNATTPFARAALNGPDQLRQRVAWALAQILVISRREASLENRPLAISDYHDILVRNAFGNYRDILTEVSLHPSMGVYLSHIGNQKADPSIPRFPDENYAREIMQLFTIGLWKLHPDGSRMLDGSGEPIPTYGNAEITQLARVFTGLWYDVRYSFGVGGWDDSHYARPMRMFPEHHDFDAKTLLDGFAIPARSPSVDNALHDIHDAVGHLFDHPNTPVYISRQLIKFLVTANPSPDYIERVQNTFVDDGTGTRGNLGAVVQAVLLDPEARNPSHYLADASYGKLREPVLRTFALARALDTGKTDSDFVWWDFGFYERALQEPFFSPSVFNFYTPVYQAPGKIRESGLVSPVFQITDTYSAISFPNLLWETLSTGLRAGNGQNLQFDYSNAREVASDPEALLDHVDLLLCSGSMSPNTRNIIREAISDPSFNDDDRIALATYLAATSPDGAIQR
ncbi:MAG: DUF1800 family protein [Verrucomicrobiales bacterium]|nr:DUF1800 family protein [Verrucomicrobiales bacterium]